MKYIRFFTLLLLLFARLLSQAQERSPAIGPPHYSAWVYRGGQGRLAYKNTDRGDRIMDFSYAGYRGGGAALPDPEIKVRIGPLPGDNTAAIQDALDRVARLPLVKGLRGAVLLAPGMYECAGSIHISASGVVLRGSGPGADGTVIRMTGTPHACIVVNGHVVERAAGPVTELADDYVPSGTMSFRVRDATGLSVGDEICITRPVTEAWTRFMGMNQLVRDGKKQTWLTGTITANRIIRKLENNKITIDVPLTDSYDAAYLDPPGTTVGKTGQAGELSEIGIEDLRILSPDQTVTINDAHHRALTMSGVADGWVRNIDVLNTVNSISITGRRITLRQVHITHQSPTIGAAKPADLNGSGQQLLFDRCTITGDNLFFFGTGARVTGPVVLLNCVFQGNGWIQPHQRWATGLLVDNCEVPGGGIDFMNRGAMGSGHGWAIGWAVAWNCKARSYLNQQPPGAMNWVIGSTGERQKHGMPFLAEPLLPEGTYDAYGTRVSPGSLYLAQLAERLGPQAVAHTGYAPEEAGQ